MSLALWIILVILGVVLLCGCTAKVRLRLALWHSIVDCFSMSSSVFVFVILRKRCAEGAGLEVLTSLLGFLHVVFAQKKSEAPGTGGGSGAGGGKTRAGMDTGDLRRIHLQRKEDMIKKARR